MIQFEYTQRRNGLLGGRVSLSDQPLQGEHWKGETVPVKDFVSLGNDTRKGLA